MNNKNQFNILPLYLLFLILFSCTTNKYLSNSLWAEDVKSGKVSFKATDFVLLPETRLFVRLVNNEKALQVQIRTEDPNTIRKLMMNGLEIWLDPQGKQHKTLGILFPSAKQALRGMKPDNGKNFELSILVNSISLMGASMMSKGETLPASLQTATIYLDDNKQLNYQVTIPYSQITASPGLPAPLSLGIISERPLPQGRPKPGEPVDERQAPLQFSNDMDEPAGHYVTTRSNRNTSSAEDGSNAYLKAPLIAWIDLKLASKP